MSSSSKAESKLETKAATDVGVTSYLSYAIEGQDKSRITSGVSVADYATCTEDQIDAWIRWIHFYSPWKDVPLTADDFYVQRELHQEPGESTGKCFCLSVALPLR